MLRQTSVPIILTLVLSVSYAKRVAFAPSPTTHHASPITSRSPSWSFGGPGSILTKNDVRARGSNRNPHHTSFLNAIPSPVSSVSPDALTPSFFFPSIITSYDGDMSADQAFQDDVSLSSLASDPTLQIEFAVAVVAIILLFAAKAIVNQLDGAVQQTALEFDRVMKLKYPKKWGNFMDDDDLFTPGEESEADRIQRIVEEMERLTNEEPQFMERVMQDVERMKR